VAVSAVSVWEIEIKRALRRLSAPADVLDVVRKSAFRDLPVSSAHAVEAGRLPLHHRDPFDRMLIAQARVEDMTLATADATFAVYDVPLLSVTRR
jgi:PIN domain nuclease of toxin-antitoxin system